MIFGFNTDIRHENTVYHVQSEAREAEQLLQTQVFVQGRCIGKRAIPYGSNAANATVSSGNDQDKEKLLRELHREMLDAIRDGKIESIFDKRDTPSTLATVKQLELEWINVTSVHATGSLMMQIRVTDGGTTVEGARLTLRLARPDALPYYAQVVTDAKGNAEMSFPLDDSVLGEASVLVQANFAGRTATRKFQFRASA